MELEDKVLGIVGLGRIGKEVGKKSFQGFGMKVIYYDPVVEDKEFTSVSLEDLFKSADFVSLHAPLTKDTENVGEKLLSLMKEEAFLINTARGELVDEEALYRFLQEKRIKGAAFDVLTFEPPFESPLSISS